MNASKQHVISKPKNRSSCQPSANQKMINNSVQPHIPRINQGVDGPLVDGSIPSYSNHVIRKHIQNKTNSLLARGSPSVTKVGTSQYRKVCSRPVTTANFTNHSGSTANQQQPYYKSIICHSVPVTVMKNPK